MIEVNQNKFWGNYRGLVTSNTDPLLKGRCQVRVLPMFSGAVAADLPWAVPAMPLFCGAASGQGSWCVPTVGSWVWCFFEAGEYTQPVYFAEAGNGALTTPVSGGDPAQRGFVYGAASIKVASGSVSVTGTTINLN